MEREIVRFKNRADAGRRLGAALKACGETGTLVLGIPRGGVEVAYHVAAALGAEMSILVVRKLPFPGNPEAGFGAIAEDGSIYFVPEADRFIPRGVVERIIREQRAEVTRRVEAFRRGQPLPDLRGRNVLLVDDGIAMGSTTQAAVACCRNLGAGRVIVAAPVASPEAYMILEAVADEVVILMTPPFFQAVAEFYDDWYDVPDEEVIALAGRAEQEGFGSKGGDGGADRDRTDA